MTTFENVVYWHDFADKEDVKLDLKIQVLNPCEEYEIYLKKLRTTDLPQVLEEEFSVLFFDWGGMSLGNSLMEHFCRYILKHAEDHPNRFYVMVSSFTSEAMQDAINEIGNNKLFNVFLSMDDFGSWCKKYDVEKEG